LRQSACMMSLFNTLAPVKSKSSVSLVSSVWRLQFVTTLPSSKLEREKKTTKNSVVEILFVGFFLSRFDFLKTLVIYSFK